MDNHKDVKMRCCMMCKGSGLVRQRIKENKDREGYKMCARCNQWLQEDNYKKDDSNKHYKTCIKCRERVLINYYNKKDKVKVKII